jgi:membrane-bound inhibitor of C-type lysozyme
MKITLTALAIVTATSAVAGPGPEVTGSLAADMMYHCTDERTDMTYLDVLKPIIAEFTGEEKQIFNSAGRSASIKLASSGNINLDCDFVVNMVTGALK